MAKTIKKDAEKSANFPASKSNIFCKKCNGKDNTSEANIQENYNLVKLDLHKTNKSNWTYSLNNTKFYDARFQSYSKVLRFTLTDYKRTESVREVNMKLSKNKDKFTKEGKPNTYITGLRTTDKPNLFYGDLKNHNEQSNELLLIEIGKDFQYINIWIIPDALPNKEYYIKHFEMGLLTEQMNRN
jgi:hypothetical protein